jgi:predicted hydrocarbon binding protein
MRTGKQTPRSSADFPDPDAPQAPPSLDIPHPLCYIPTRRLSIAERALSSVAAGRYLPNRMLFHFYQALEATAGRTATALIWKSAGPRRECLPAVTDDLEKGVAFACFSALCEAIEREYGESGARGILEHCGRAALSQTLRSTAAIAGLDGPQLRATAGPGRMADGLASVARLLELVSDMECAVEPTPQGYRFRVSACPECLGRRSGGKICHCVCGMLRGALDWIGIDPAISIAETECIAGGAAGCDFSIVGAF